MVHEQFGLFLVFLVLSELYFFVPAYPRVHLLGISKKYFVSFFSALCRDYKV